MASTSETGHAKNIAAFKNILTYLEGYGADYQPVAETLKLTNLQQQLADAEASITEAQKKFTAFNNATDTRMKLFAPLKPIGTRIYNALSVSGVSQNTLGTAKTINRKLQGQRAIKITLPKDPSQPPADNASVSQQSYDNLVAHLSNYIELLQTLPEYNPNETELQTATLITYRNQLLQAHNTVIQATVNWSNARINRDQALYANQTGIVDTATSIKTYVKSLYGPTKPPIQANFRHQPQKSNQLNNKGPRKGPFILNQQNTKRQTATSKPATANPKRPTATIKPRTAVINLPTANSKLLTATSKPPTATLKRPTATIKPRTAIINWPTANSKPPTANPKRPTQIPKNKKPS